MPIRKIKPILSQIHNCKTKQKFERIIFIKRDNPIIFAQNMQGTTPLHSL